MIADLETIEERPLIQNDTGIYEHVDSDVRKFLHLSDSKRIQQIYTDEWLGYRKAEQLLEEMEILLNLPDSLRSPGMLIIASPNNGKTFLVNYFARLHMGKERADRSGVDFPVVLINSPHKPNTKWFLSNILRALNAPHRTTGNEQDLFNQVAGLFERLNVKMLIVDEISDVVDGTALNQRMFMNMLKGLNNEIRRPIVLTGTSRIEGVIRSDEQVSRRFPRTELLPWEVGIEFIEFLAAFERRLPLKKLSNLASSENRMLAIEILEKADFRVGYIVELLRKAARQAIINKTEKIDKRIIDSIKLQPHVWLSDKNDNL